MYLFKTHAEALQISPLANFGGTGPSPREARTSIWRTLLGEEKPSNMLSLLSVLVLLVHVWGLRQLLQPVEALTQAQPLMMEVSMIAISAPKPSVAPPPPAPAPPEKKPPEIKPKPKPKPLPKKAPPIVQKAPEYAPSEAAAETQPTPVTAPANPSPSVTQTTSTATQAEPFTEANFRANYAHNPKPEYPMIAKSRGWQGKVLLKVQVSAEGLADAVAVEHTSGHEVLDDSAVEAVKQWKFIPAKRGETPVASSVIVPIIFTLRE
ncbi:energy transducer TonB [Methylococcaceae bacterium WWC4]|nr:energy transducer TonB [Methylococcaceae bacterium WWC4]